MSPTAPNFDTRTSPNQSQITSKDDTKASRILPPISTGPEVTRREQGPMSARHVSAGSLKTEPTSPAGNGGDLSARSLRMHSILNPADHAQDRGTSLPMPISPKTQSGSGRMLPSLGAMPSPFTAGPRPTEARDGGRQGYPQSLGPLPTRSPFASAASTPLIGTPNQRPSYGFPGSTAPASERRGSDSVMTAPHSQTNSPTTSYSSFGATQRNSPAGPFAKPSGPAATSAASNQYAPRTAQGPALVLGGEAPHRSGSTSHGSYQLMTLTTDQGSIQVPVDVQAASKVADEKRKRNAGASARFRQRRKEKERESSQTISKLEGKVREVLEEKEYYRVERDYFRDLVYNSGVSVHVAPRLPSPKQRKASTVASSIASTSDTADWQQSGERGSDDGRNQRRRISGYADGHGPSPQHQQHQPPHSATYPHPPPPPPPSHHAHQAGYGPPQYAYARPDGRNGAPPGPPSAPLPMVNGHYAAHGQQPFTPAWKPQVS